MYEVGVAIYKPEISVGRHTSKVVPDGVGPGDLFVVLPEQGTIDTVLGHDHFSEHLWPPRPGRHSYFVATGDGVAERVQQALTEYRGERALPAFREYLELQGLQVGEVVCSHHQRLTDIEGNLDPNIDSMAQTHARLTLGRRSIQP